jgi:hypothetical protein
VEPIAGIWYSKYFDAIPHYTACILKGFYAGRVGEVTAMSNQWFSIAKAGLALVEMEGVRVPVPIEALERI